MGSATTPGQQANGQRHKNGRLVFVMAQKHQPTSPNDPDPRAIRFFVPVSKQRLAFPELSVVQSPMGDQKMIALHPPSQSTSSNSTFILPEVTDVQAPTELRRGYGSDLRAIVLQPSSLSPHSKPRFIFPEVARVQTPTEFRRGYGSETTAIAPHSHGWSPQFKSRFIFPVLADVQSPSTVASGGLQSGAPRFQMATANKGDTNIYYLKPQSTERKDRMNEDCECDLTTPSSLSARRTSNKPSWHEPQILLPDVEEDSEEKDKMATTNEPLSAQNTANRTVNLPPTQQPSVLSLRGSRQSEMRGHLFGRQEICQEMAESEGSLNLKKSTGHRPEAMSTSNMVRERLPPTQRTSVVSSHLKSYSVLAGRRLGRQEICREIVATEGSSNKPSDIEYRREAMSTCNTVHDQTARTQKPSVMSLHLNQTTAFGARRLCRREICHERNQRTRRHGVCDGSDSTQHQRVFVRVLNKRF